MKASEFYLCVTVRTDDGGERDSKASYVKTKIPDSYDTTEKRYALAAQVAVAALEKEYKSYNSYWSSYKPLYRYIDNEPKEFRRYISVEIPFPDDRIPWDGPEVLTEISLFVNKDEASIKEQLDCSFKDDHFFEDEKDFIDYLVKEGTTKKDDDHEWIQIYKKTDWGNLHVLISSTFDTCQEDYDSLYDDVIEK